MIVNEEVVHRHRIILALVSTETDETNDDEGRDDERLIGITSKGTVMRTTGANRRRRRKIVRSSGRPYVATVFRLTIAMITSTAMTRKTGAEIRCELSAAARGTHESLASHRIERP